MSGAEAEPGDPLGEHYRVREVLSGGMGQIFVCDWERDEDGESDANEPLPVALKTFQRRFFFNNAARLSFVREASTWLRLSNVPHIMPVIGIETILDRPFIVMPAVSPGPLGERSIADLIERGPVDPDDALAFAFQIALALEAASGRIPGLVHGDLKPANVLLLHGDAFLSDFGLVSAMGLGRPGLRLHGTWAYRAPELWSEEVAPNVAGDVYAFGALLFEMLAGRPPLEAVADTPEAWATAHRESSPNVPRTAAESRVGEASMELALECLAKDPGERPTAFAEVRERIRAIYEQFDPATLLMLMMRAHQMQDAMLQLAPDARHLRIGSLLSLGEFEQALQELEVVPASDYDARLWVARGIALNLANQPGEALESLQRGLNENLAPDERIGALSEYALALKRLGRFDEAERIYDELMTTISDDRLPLVLVNLATVYLAQDRGEEALRLLEPFVRKAPQVSEGWANLGLAYAMVARYEDAVAAFGRALLIAPQEGYVRVELAAVYMDHLGELEQAWAALDAAFDAGYESREWFVRMLASSLLLDRQDPVQGMLRAAQNTVPEDVGRSMVEEAIEMARSLAEKYAGAVEDEGETDERPDESTEHQEVTSEPKEVAAERQDVTAKPGVPFVNFRYYDFREFTIDYYQWPNADDFVPALLAELRRARRDPRIGVGGATLRGSAFYFTICPGCGITVLTNRDLGKEIRCRMCEAISSTTPVHGDPFDGIVADVSAELGIAEREDATTKEAHVLFVQTLDTAARDVVEDTCHEAGMVELEANRLMSVFMLRDAVSRGLAKRELPWSVWVMTSSDGEAWARGSTPRAISRIVGDLQELVPEVMTLSTTLTEDELASMNETVEEIEEEEERKLRLAVQSGGAEARDLRRLASLLERRGESREAESKARAASAADESSAEGWEILGRALLRQDDFAGAKDALEESLMRDPTSVLAMMMLAHSYEQLGDGRRADELRVRANSQTGGEFG
jgi:tetratricopeptide (TPR) repeat protein